MLSKQIRAPKPGPTQGRVGIKMRLNCESHTVFSSGQGQRIKGHQGRPLAPRQLAPCLRYGHVLCWVFINFRLFPGKRKVTRFILPISQMRKLIPAWENISPLGPGAWHCTQPRLLSWPLVPWYACSSSGALCHSPDIVHFADAARFPGG